MADFSSEEENVFPDSSQDEDFARRLFNDLNCDLLGLPDDGKFIVLSDSDEEEEDVHKEDIANAEATPSSAMKSSTPTLSTADADVVPEGTQDDNSDGKDEAGSL
jgi:hypothetical protein